MNLVVAEALSQLTGGTLDREQQGRLAVAWMRVYVDGHAAGATDDAWRKALGYTAREWEGVREAYRDLLEREGGLWGLPFMAAECERQRAVSREQARRVSVRYRGIPKPTAVESGIPEPTGVYPATTTTTESKPMVEPQGFAEFWEAYRCERRRNKPKAVEVWKRMGLSALGGEVMIGLSRFKGSRKWRDGFMPEPHRWLSARGWEDDVDPAPAPVDDDPLWGMKARKGGAR